MPALDPGIHVLALTAKKDVDGRVKPGHDVRGCMHSGLSPHPRRKDQLTTSVTGCMSISNVSRNFDVMM